MAQRLAAQLSKANEKRGVNMNSTVQALQNYFLNNSNIQIFSLMNSQGSPEDVRLSLSTLLARSCPGDQEAIDTMLDRHPICEGCITSGRLVPHVACIV
jgi:hypothetical protein